MYRFFFLILLFAAFFLFSDEERVSLKARFVPVKEGALFCQVIGKGSPVVVLHGGPGWSQDYFLPYMEKLVKKRTLVFYDQRGCGRSVGPIREDLISFKQFVEDLEILRRSMRAEKISLVGHDTGGLIAILYAASVYGEHVDKIVLMDPIPPAKKSFFSWVDKKGRFKESLDIKDLFDLDNFMLESFYKKMCEDFFMISSTLNFSIRMPLEGYKRGAQVAYFLEKNYEPDFSTEKELLNRIKAHVLLIHGWNSPLEWNFLETLHRYIPKSRYTVINHAGHFPYLEQPQVFFRLTQDFLKESSP